MGPEALSSAARALYSFSLLLAPSPQPRRARRRARASGGAGGRGGDVSSPRAIALVVNAYRRRHPRVGLWEVGAEATTSPTSSSVSEFQLLVGFLTCFLLAILYLIHATLKTTLKTTEKVCMSALQNNVARPAQSSDM